MNKELETISEEQFLHNKLSFEINQELIHLMKRIIEVLQENKELKEQLENASNNYTKYIQERDNKIDKAIKYMDNTFNISTVKDMFDIIKNIDQDFLKHTISGKNFKSLFNENCDDSKLSNYIKSLIQ